MFEIAETVTLARQMNEVLPGKVVRQGELGNSPHKFVWYNRTHEEFAWLTQGTRAGETVARGRWLCTPLEPGYVLVLGECGGKLLYHPAGAQLPEKYHLRLIFEDGSALTAMTQMWGAMELYAQGEEEERPYIKGMRPTPVDPAFTFAYFDALVDEVMAKGKQSAKGLLTLEQTIPGLGNAIAQDILFQARLHPRHPLEDLAPGQRRALYQAIRGTVQAAIDCGGRDEEFDLYGRRGRYIRLMDKRTAGHACPACGSLIQKITYLGGSCYVCPGCQV